MLQYPYEFLNKFEVKVMKAIPLTQKQAEKVLRTDLRRDPTCPWPDLADFNNPSMAIWHFLCAARRERTPFELLLSTGAKLIFRHRPVPTTHRRIVLSSYAAQDEDIAPYLTAIGA